MDIEKNKSRADNLKSKKADKKDKLKKIKKVGKDKDGKFKNRFDESSILGSVINDLKTENFSQLHEHVVLTITENMDEIKGILQNKEDPNFDETSDHMSDLYAALYCYYNDHHADGITPLETELGLDIPNFLKSNGFIPDKGLSTESLSDNAREMFDALSEYNYDKNSEQDQSDYNNADDEETSDDEDDYQDSEEDDGEFDFGDDFESEDDEDDDLDLSNS